MTRLATPIAIIGIGCRLPGGVCDAASFWSLLRDGRCAIREIPPERWSLEGFWDSTPDLPHRSYSKWGGFLDDIRSFDAAYFGLSPREAEAMDPQQRLLLMTACEAAQDARLPLSALRDARAGVFIGVSNVDYGLLQRHRSGVGDIQAGTGTALSIVANRVSNRLDLTGPSMGVDTACSSALVALDTACRHLSDGSCDMALAGGVNVLLDPRMFVTFCRAHMLSPTGRIRAFDASADGFVRGEGAGVVLLRRLEDAVAAGDRVYAVIDGTAVNQDGRTGTITEPSADAQVVMLRAAVERAGIDPAEIAYAEAHGTGTVVGDPIEANAIGAVLGGAARRNPLLIGSAKTNIGHLEPAAGIAGLIKTALVLHRREVPPSLGFERPNPAIAFDELRLAVVRDLTPLPDRSREPRALVNSFGFGGTNACAILRGPGAHAGWPKTFRCVAREAMPGGDAAAPVPIPLAAPTQAHLSAFAAALVREIDDGALARHPLREIGAALAGLRDNGEHRAVLIASTVNELRDRLACLAEDREWPQTDRHAPPQIIRGRARATPRLAFTMTGQGGQWWAMGRELMSREQAFRRVFEDFDDIFRPVAGWSVIAELLADEAASRIDDAAITPAVMFAFQAGLAEVWRARGVMPALVLGHSFGEVTAAYLAGGIGGSDVARLVDQRGLIRHRVDRRGTMAAIGLGAEAIASLLPADGSIEIGGYNSPTMVTLTGEEAAIDGLIARLNADNPSILTRKLALDFAYHSSWFEPVEQIFKAAVGTLSTAPPRLPVISTVTGALNDDFSADYWWRNLRYPVLYQAAIERALDQGVDTFVELGPHRTLSSMTAACASAKGREVVTVSTLDRRWGDLMSIAVATGQLYVSGIPIDWKAVLGPPARHVDLPAQPWLLRELWIEPEEARAAMQPAPVHPLLGQRAAGTQPTWHNEVSLATHAWLGDHRVDGECVLAAAAYLDMLTVAAREILQRQAVELIDVTFPAALYIGADDEVILETRYDADRRRLGISSRLRGTEAWQLRAACTIFPHASRLPSALAHWGHAACKIPPQDFYRDAGSAGYGWSGHFQGLTGIEVADATARGRIAVPHAAPLGGAAFALDPRVVDCALQLIFASDLRAGRAGALPFAIDRVVAGGSIGCEASAHAAVTRDDAANAFRATVAIAGPGDGGVVVRIDGLHARSRRRRNTSLRALDATPGFYIETFERIVPTPTVAEPQRSGSWLILTSDACSIAPRLAAELRGRGRDARIARLPAAHNRQATAIAAAIRDATAAGPLARIVHAAPVSAAETDDIAEMAISLVCGVVALGQSLAKLAQAHVMPPVHVLTRGARAIESADRIAARGIAQAAVLGAVRTLALELPTVGFRLIDLDGDDCNGLIDALFAPGDETEIAIRAGQVHAARLMDCAAEELVPEVVPLSASVNMTLARRGAPGIDGLVWREAPRLPLGPDDVEIEVRACGLNFRDVMAVVGLLPDGAEPSPAAQALGLELSGIVTAVGSNVGDLTLGTHVFGMGRGALRRHVCWPRLAVRAAPKDLSHVEAATVPAAYLTAFYALAEVGRLARGETVLIHSASGGVGLAAVAVARLRGARIIATAGTPEKREFLTRHGIAHVLCSRSLAFAEEVLAITQGCGVDVVLNALSGDFIEKGLACLAPYGRFLELGKRDVYADSALGLRRLAHNASLHVIDVARLIADKPDLAVGMLADITGMLERGEIAPLPAATFPASSVREAFATFAAARHIGKIVVDLDDAATRVERGLADGATLDAAGTYLVTGGARGFGRAVAEWLQARGAGHVVIAARTAPQSGAGLEAVALDVRDADATLELIGRLQRSDKPLRGIVHAAVVYDDALLPEMSTARVRRVIEPKLQGAVHLTHAVQRVGAALDFFVTFSSMAQVVGWPGQSNYAAANSALAALAAWQRARGIPGRCINWGALGESGHVARRPEMQSYLASAGFPAMDNRMALEALAQALDSNHPVMSIGCADWRHLASTQAPLTRMRRLAGLLASCQEGSHGVERALADLSGEALSEACLQLIRRLAARVLRRPSEEMASFTTLTDAGIDSLSSFELHNRIGQEIGLDVPMARYVKARGFAELADLVATLVVEARLRRDASG